MSGRETEREWCVFVCLFVFDLQHENGVASVFSSLNKCVAGDSAAAAAWNMTPARA